MTQNPYRIIQCSKCGAKNRIPEANVNLDAKCGKCHQPLTRDKEQRDSSGNYKLRCTHCGAKNRVPAHKINAGAKCGKCGEVLKTEELFAPQPFMLTDGNFEEKVMKSPLPVLLYAWATW
jgi:uncharacterized paraquat-inducible protein A